MSKIVDTVKERVALVIVIPTYAAYVDRFELFRRQAELYSQVCVVSKGVPEGFFGGKAIVHNIEERGLGFVIEARRIALAVARENPDVGVLVHNYLFNWTPILFKPKNMILLTSFVHSDFSYLFSSTLFQMRRLGYSWKTIASVAGEQVSRVLKACFSIAGSNAILSNSSADHNWIQWCKPFYSFNSEIDDQFFEYNGEAYNTKKVVFVGSLQQRKNVDLLAKLVSSTKGVYDWVIVGRNGYSDPHVSQLMEQMRASGALLIDFLDREGLRELYAGAFMFVMPSFYEGSPRTLKEALVSGLKCVASDIPGHQMLATHFHNLKIVENSLEGFSLALGEWSEERAPKRACDVDMLGVGAVSKVLDSIYIEVLEAAQR